MDAPKEEPKEETKAAEAPVEDTKPGAKLVCVSCGTEFEKGKFCTVCGGDLRAVSAEEPKEEIKEEALVEEPEAEEAPVIPVIQEAPKLRCTVCGSEFDKGKFCTVCGGALAAPKAEEPAKAETPAAGLRCKECGKEYDKGKFCTVCGGMLIPADMAPPVKQILHCEQCGRVFEQGKFCTGCGGKLVYTDANKLPNFTT